MQRVLFFRPANQEQCVGLISSRDITQWFNENIAILVALAKIQYTHDDEPTISCIKPRQNIDNEVYYVDEIISLTSE
jgi:hypothetical protein